MGLYMEREHKMMLLIEETAGLYNLKNKNTQQRSQNGMSLYVEREMKRMILYKQKTKNSMETTAATTIKITTVKAKAKDRQSTRKRTFKPEKQKHRDRKRRTRSPESRRHCCSRQPAAALP